MEHAREVVDAGGLLTAIMFLEAFRPLFPGDVAASMLKMVERCVSKLGPGELQPLPASLLAVLSELLQERDVATIYYIWVGSRSQRYSISS